MWNCYLGLSKFSYKIIILLKIPSDSMAANTIKIRLFDKIIRDYIIFIFIHREVSQSPGIQYFIQLFESVL